MRYLLDTQAVIWFIENNPRLSYTAKSFIEDPDNIILVSQFSFVEIAIKEALRKLSLKNGLESLIKETEKQDIQVLNLNQNHILAYKNIPLHENHRDPFDRMILATAFSEKLPIITSDEKFSWYAPLIDVVW